MIEIFTNRSAHLKIQSPSSLFTDEEQQWSKLKYHSDVEEREKYRKMRKKQDPLWESEDDVCHVSILVLAKINQY